MAIECLCRFIANLVGKNPSTCWWCFGKMICGNMYLGNFALSRRRDMTIGLAEARESRRSSSLTISRHHVHANTGVCRLRRRWLIQSEVNMSLTFPYTNHFISEPPLSVWDIGVKGGVDLGPIHIFRFEQDNTIQYHQRAAVSIFRPGNTFAWPLQAHGQPIHNPSPHRNTAVDEDQFSNFRGFYLFIRSQKCNVLYSGS